MSQRVPASMNTRQSPSELIEGRLSTADGRNRGRGGDLPRALRSLCLGQSVWQAIKIIIGE